MIGRIRTDDVFHDSSFPLACCRINAHADCDLHRHDFHEIVIILAGRGRHVTDTEEYALQAGDAFMVRGEMAHGYTDTRDLVLVNILFDPHRLRLPLSDLHDLPGYHVLFRVEPHMRNRERFRGRLRLAPPDLAETAAVIALLQDELEKKPPGYRFIACALLMRLIGFLSRCYSQAGHPEVRNLMRFGEVLSYVEGHFGERITVGQLARKAGMSESSLIRVFRRVTGWSPMNHVIRIRIWHAQELLARSDMRVTEIAYRCGFNDSNYFSRQFRKVAGVTPKAYRARTMESLQRPRS